MLSPNLACISGYQRVSIILCWNSIWWFLKHVKFLVETRHSDFPELRPCHEQSEMPKILDSFEKKNRRKIDNGFGTIIEDENIQLFRKNQLASLVVENP